MSQKGSHVQILTLLTFVFSYRLFWLVSSVGLFLLLTTRVRGLVFNRVASHINFSYRLFWLVGSLGLFLLIDNISLYPYVTIYIYVVDTGLVGFL